MPDSGFDPYYAWLGIPSTEQPADYYRLLGISRFENESLVISNAAERQMRHIKTFQLGEHARHSQTILNELATARACLLNVASKAAYDQQLRAQIAEQNPPPVAPVPAKTSSAQRSARRRPRNPLVEVVKIVVGGMAGLTIGVLLLWYGFGTDVLGVMESRDERPTQLVTQDEKNVPQTLFAELEEAQETDTETNAGNDAAFERVTQDDSDLRQSIVAEVEETPATETKAENLEAAVDGNKAIASANAPPTDPLTPVNIRSRLVGTTWLHDAEHNNGTWFRFNGDGTIAASWHDLPSMWAVLPDGTVQMIFTQKRIVRTMRVDATFMSGTGLGKDPWLYQRIVAELEKEKDTETKAEVLEAVVEGNEAIASLNAPPPESVTPVDIRSRLVGTTWIEGDKASLWFRFNADGTVTASWHKLPSMWAVLPDGTVQMIFTKTRVVKRMRVDATLSSGTGIGKNAWPYQRIQQ